MKLLGKYGEHHGRCDHCERRLPSNQLLGHQRRLFPFIAGSRLGWPGTMGRLRANLNRMDVPIKEIRYSLATHYHIDHAGLAQELKQTGVPLLVFNSQVHAISLMRTWIKPEDHYVDITLHDNVTISFADSRRHLEQIGIAGEILPTPGHSDDSISLLLDNDSVFTGDLTHPAFIGAEDPEVVLASWQLLRERGASECILGTAPFGQ